jgi:NAD(P)-dependent dehydrogenase (short-subunit alcohol dehydrogenase family)
VNPSRDPPGRAASPDAGAAPSRPVFDLEGRVAVVTGGNKGIGLGVARVLGTAGATVWLWARDDDATRRAVDLLEEEGIVARGLHCDVTDERQVVAAGDTVAGQAGRIDVMVANAGSASNVRFLDTTIEQWDSLLRTNLTSAFLCFREAARQMVSGGQGGALVAVASIAAIHGAPTLHHYAAAKSGLGGLVRSLAVELAPYRIRVNTVLPGWTDSNIHDRPRDASMLREETIAAIPARRWGTPEDVGKAVLYLADPALAYHTGAEVVVDGGYSKMPPYLAARYITDRSTF